MSDLIKNSDLEKLLLEQKDVLKINIEPPFYFKINPVKKVSEYKTICLTIFDQNQKPYYVIKFPEKGSDIANKMLELEYEKSVQLAQSGIDIIIPKIRGRGFINGRVFICSDYIENTIFEKMIYSSKENFNLDLLKKPLDWLLLFNLNTCKYEQLPEQYFLDFEVKFFHLVNTYEDKEIVNLINILWNTFKPKIFSLCKTKIPLVATHGDFTSVNIGFTNNKKLVVFDWEDYVEKFPILFDFFCYTMVFFWQLFDNNNSELRLKSFPRNFHGFYKIIERYINEFQKKFPGLKQNFDNLYLFSLFYNIYCDLNEKRKPKDQKLRLDWIIPLVDFKSGTALLRYFKSPKIQKSIKETLSKND